MKEKDREPDDKRRRTYDPPQVVHTEKMVGKAASCAKADAACATGSQSGPIQS